MRQDDRTSRPDCAPEGSGPVGRALTDGGSIRVGWFRYFFDDEHWEWSPQVQQMHGYEPGTVSPTTELVLSHKHPDDYRQVADTLQLIRETRQAFRIRHRILDVHGKVHHIAVLGDEIRDEDGRTIGTYGFYVDLTREEQARHDQVTAKVADISERRSAIEQANGMLMMVYNVDDAVALELLKWRSQECNVKLGRLAEQIVADFMTVRHNGEMSRATYDNLFLTAHNRAAEASGYGIHSAGR